MTFTKTRRELEPSWVSWYCAKTWPKDEIRYRVPLGPVPAEITKAYGETKGINVYRPWRPEVDALVIQKGGIVLLEAKIQKFMDGLSKLPVYKSLIPTTPELLKYRAYPVELRLLIPASVAWVVASAHAQNILVIVDAPDYILDAWNDRDKYWTKEATEERDRRKQKLKELGL